MFKGTCNTPWKKNVITATHKNLWIDFLCLFQPFIAKFLVFFAYLQTIFRSILYYILATEMDLKWS